MKHSRLDFIIAFLISFCFHALLIIFCIYKLFDNNKLNISDNDENKDVFSISFSQIVSNNIDQESASKINEISNNTQESLVSKESHQEQEEQKIQEEPEILEEPPVQEEAVREIDEEQFRPKPEKPKVVKNKTNPQKSTYKSNEKADDLSKNSGILSNTVSNTQANSDMNAIGGSNGIANSKNSKNNLSSNVLGEIYAALKKYKTYPKKALMRKIRGKVVVEFKLKDSNNFEYINIVQSSGHEILDKHAVKIVNLAKKSFPKEAIGLSIKVPIVFDINKI